jgi:SAM-dependent methyltransferase
MLTTSNKKAINSLFNSISKDEEFEIMFNNYRSDNQLSLIDFMNVLKYIRYLSEQHTLKLSESVSLDVFYVDYRISIDGLENINNFLSLVYQRKNNNILSILVTQYLDKDGFKLIQKIKEKSNIIDIDELDIRVRKSKEMPITEQSTLKILSKLSMIEGEKVNYRYKQRLTLELEPGLVIDLTTIKAGENVNQLSTAQKTFEVEIDYTKDNKSKTKDDDVLETIYKYMENIKKVLSNSDSIINKQDELNIIEKYKKLVYNNSYDNSGILYSMQPISAEVQHIVDSIPNKYTATDKADGEKFQLFIIDDEIYLISNNLHIKKTDIKVKNLNETIAEGELIHIVDKQVYIFMMFDCLYYKGEDIRQNILLSNRIKYLKEISEYLKIKPFMINEYNEKTFNLNNIKKYYTKNIKLYYSELNKEIEKINKNDILIYPKMFLFPTGANPSEVFLYSDLIWTICTKDSETSCPYVLDGIIFTAIEQKYAKERKEQRYPTYKYKPPHTNSLDVFITFEKNKETGGYMDMYDNSLPEKIVDKVFRVVNLFVGEVIGGREQPVPFMKEQNNHIIYLPLVDDNIRDIEGNIILDRTVVEIVYNNNPNMPHQYRWEVLRTRWDKTESVMKYNKRFGNNKDVAEKVWKSMIESVTTEEIANLAEPKNYDMQMKLLSSRLDSSIINTQKKQDIYYQKITNLLKKLREFHNWIKSIIIYTYCSPTSSTLGGKNVRQSMLDIGCGRGGDILKVYHARVGEYVGIDVDFEGIYSATDGAISRYNFLKTKFPDFGKVSFIQADGGIILDSESQLKAIPNLSKDNIKALDKVFKDRKFDIISSQFVIHYLFKDLSSISNLIHNIRTYLKKDGYVLLTLFDPERLEPLFDDNNRITSYYTDDDGKRNILYEIVKKYTGKIDDEIGHPVDVHMSWISEEGKYIEEYLVSKKLMINTMEKAGCKLVDTELFANIYQYNKPYFENVIKYEENPKNKQFYEKIAEFYGDLKGADKESRNYSFLFRYYVFQKLI